jgi:barstar (barnase inhibitor)
MADQPMNLNEFLVQAGGYGPCIGLLPPSPAPLTPPPGVELRTMDGASITDFGTLLGAFAGAWQFPSSFRPNPNAFNDFMRDLDGMIDVAFGRPPALGYLTEVTDAHLLLVNDPETFKWLADHIPFYRDYYRDEADPAASFGLLLSAPAEHLVEVRNRLAGTDAEAAPFDTGVAGIRATTGPRRCPARRSGR